MFLLFLLILELSSWLVVVMLDGTCIETSLHWEASNSTHMHRTFAIHRKYGHFDVALSILVFYLHIDLLPWGELLAYCAAICWIQVYMACRMRHEFPGPTRALHCTPAEHARQ